MDKTILLLETLHAYLHGVRHLLIIIEEYLLADNLRDEELGGLVGELLFVEIGG